MHGCTFGVCVRSTFQHSGAALPAPPLGGVLGGATFSLIFCWAVLPGLLWVLLRFLFFSVVLPSFPSFGWVFPSLQLGGAAWPPPSLGRGALPPHTMGWVVGVLGGCVWRWCLVVECWVGCWVAKRMGGVCGVDQHERILLLRFCHCLWVWVCGGVGLWECVLMASIWMSWFVFVVVCLFIFLHFFFVFFVLFCFFEICVSDFSSFFHDSNVQCFSVFSIFYRIF